MTHDRTVCLCEVTYNMHHCICAFVNSLAIYLAWSNIVPSKCKVPSASTK